MSETLTPVFRLEYFIVAAANGTPCDLEPIFNEEKYLHAIAGASVDLPMPVGRTQQYLAKLAGMDVEIPDNPIFRTEYYLAHMIDNTVECPAPIFREEMFYYEWASNEYVTITGNPVTFSAISAPLKQLSVAFSPVQDLNGYDSPWPAGGGVNKLVDGAWVTGQYVGGEWSISWPDRRTSPYCPITPETEYHISVDLDETQDLAWINYNYFDADKNWLGDRVANGDTSFNGQREKTFTIHNSNARYVRLTVRAYSDLNKDISAQDIMLAKPMLVLGSTAPATYSPYSNICPISGWSSLTVEQTGKNLFGGTLINGHVDFSTVAGATYTASAKIADPSVFTYFYIRKAVIGSDTYTTVGNVITNTTVTPVTFTAEAGYKYALWSNASYTNVTDVMLNLGSTASEYVPYNGRSISITIGQTVYSGTIDVVTGQGEVTMASVDMGTLNWVIRNNSANRQAWKIYNNQLPENMKVVANAYPYPAPLLTDIFKTVVPNTTWTPYQITQYDAELVATVAPSQFEAADDFIAYVNGHQLVYELATPTTIQLTPQQVSSLLGDNVLFSDANADLTVEYRSN